MEATVQGQICRELYTRGQDWSATRANCTHVALGGVLPEALRPELHLQLLRKWFEFNQLIAVDTKCTPLTCALNQPKFFVWSKNEESNQLVALSQVTTQHYQSPDHLHWIHDVSSVWMFWWRCSLGGVIWALIAKQSSNLVSTPKRARHSVPNRVLEATQAMPTSRQREFDTNSGKSRKIEKRILCVYVLCLLCSLNVQKLDFDFTSSQFNQKSWCLPRPCDLNKVPSVAINDRQKSLYKTSAKMIWVYNEQPQVRH